MLKCDWSDGLVRLRTLSFEGSRTVAEVLEPCKVAAVHGPEGEAVARAGGDDDEDSVLAVYIDRSCHQLTPPRCVRAASSACEGRKCL